MEPNGHEGGASPSEGDEGLLDADFLIKYEDLRFGAEVAEGAYGKIFRGDYFGTEVAIKKFVESGYPEDDQKYIAREVATLKGIRHPNIVTFMGVCQHSSGIYIVTEWIPNGDLTNLLKDMGRPITWKERVQMLLDAAVAMRYLHGHNIIHRDLKSENLLLTDNGRIKVCDLGFARTTKKLTRNMSVAGTELYMAPEVIIGEPYDEKCDIFGFGVVMFEVICRHPPPKRSPDTKFGFPPGLLPQYMPDDCPADLALLTLECVAYDKEERPSFEVIFNKLKEMNDDLSAEENADKEEKTEAERAKQRREREEREKKEKEERERREREERERRDKEEREKRDRAAKERRDKELRDRREKQEREKREKELQDRRVKEDKEREAQMRSQIEKEVRERLEQETRAIREKLELEYALKEKEREEREKKEREEREQEWKAKEEASERQSKERIGNGHADVRKDVQTKDSPKEAPKESPKGTNEKGSYPRSATTSGETRLLNSGSSLDDDPDLVHRDNGDAGSSSGDDSDKRVGRVGKNAKKKQVKKKAQVLVSTFPKEEEKKVPGSPKGQRARNNRSWGFRKGSSKAALVVEDKKTKSGDALAPASDDMMKADKQEKRLRRRTWAPIRGLFFSSEEDFARAMKEEEKQKEKEDKKDKEKEKDKKEKKKSKTKSKEKDKVKSKEKEKDKDKEAKAKTQAAKRGRRKSNPTRIKSTKSAENIFLDPTKKAAAPPAAKSASSGLSGRPALLKDKKDKDKDKDKDKASAEPAFAFG